MLGDAAMQRLGFPSDRHNKPGFDLLSALGFSRTEIDDANDVVCGRMTIEGAPHLKDAHLAVFDCANRCGKHGKRFIAPRAHLSMMAAAQPFISGAISKTVNVPRETTAEEIEALFTEGWRLGLKAVAIYRDASKLSQPLSASTKGDGDASEKQAEAATPQDQKPSPSAARPIRHRLPRKRLGFTQEAHVAGQKVFLRTGEYEDSTLGEIFIDMHKEGAPFRSMLNCFAIAISKGLQYGVPLKEFVDTFTFTRFEPWGTVDHPNVKFATSVIDYIFRVLGFEYLGRTDFLQVKPEDLGSEVDYQDAQDSMPGDVPNAQATSEAEGSNGSGAAAAPPRAGDPAGGSGAKQQATGGNGSPQYDQHTRPVATGVLDEQLSQMMGDAPFCDVCGHITVRNGSCYKCLNCGNSVGCS